MARFETSTVINRPLEEVFALLSNAENDPKWQSGTIEAKKTSDGPIGVGTTWRRVSQLIGQRIESESEITEYELNRKYAVKSKSGPFPFEGRITFEQVNGGTRINLKGEAEVGGFFKLAEPLVVSLAKRQFEADNANLKDLMEAHAL